MKKVFKAILIIIVINTAVTSLVYRFRNEGLTETQLFKHIPLSFIWNFRQ